MSYLRVSTKEQAERGGREEGFSIPARRQANARKADSLNADIVAEFVDAGESARTADRPHLQAMLAYVSEHPVQYCIVHKLDRLARNRADDVAIHFSLQQVGVTLVSTTENIDETPSGMLMHGIMSSIAEFYSRNLANEVTKGLVQKASLGGTVARAPLGYRNVSRTDHLGRGERTVEVDIARARLVTWAHLHYADGKTSLSQLLDELTARGLTTRPTPKLAEKPLTISTLHKMLHNPYYKGEILYRGVRYPGQHPPLIDPATWQRVQDLLAANHLAGNRPTKHEHYLKGSVYCGGCGSRLMLAHATNRWGQTYPYFVCVGRQRRRRRTRRAMLTTAVEDLVEAEYRTIALSPKLRDTIEADITEDFDALHAAADAERRQLSHQRDRALAQRAKLLEAHYAGATPLDLLKTEQDRLATQLAGIETQLAHAATTYDRARRTLADCLDLARDCHAAYQQADEPTKRLFNQAFFTKIYIDEDDTVHVDYQPPFDQLLDRTIPARRHRQLQQAGALALAARDGP